MNNTTDESILTALLNLIDDPDPEVFSQIEHKVVEIGSTALPYLKHASTVNKDELSDKRIKTLYQKIQFNKTEEALKNWLLQGQLNLLDAAIIFTCFHYPELDEKIIRKQVEKIKKDVWLELSDEFTALEKIHILNHVLFEIYHFKGNKTHVLHHQSSLLSDLIEKRNGSSVILAILYLEIAQSLDLPVLGVNLPENFVLAYTNSDRMLSDSKVLFYINPFNKGIVFMREDIDSFINQLNLKPKKQYFEPCDNITIVKRLAEELFQSYDTSGEHHHKDSLRKFLKILG